MAVSRMKDTGWSWVVALACCCCHCMQHGTTRLSGMLLIHFVRNFGVNRTLASMPFSVCNSVLFLSGPFVGFFGERFGMRTVTATGCLLASLGVALCYFAEDIVWATVFWGIIYGLGNGMGTTLLPVVINQNFDKYLSTASGISYSGAYIGSFILPPITMMALEHYGFSGFFLILSGIMMQSVIAAILFKPNERSSEEKRDFDHPPKIEQRKMSKVFKKSNSFCNMISLVKGTNPAMDKVFLCPDESSVEGKESQNTKKSIFNERSRRFSSHTIVSSESCSKLSQILSSKLEQANAVPGRRTRHFSSSSLVTMGGSLKNVVSRQPKRSSGGLFNIYSDEDCVDQSSRLVLIPTDSVPKTISNTGMRRCYESFHELPYSSHINRSECEAMNDYQNAENTAKGALDESNRNAVADQDQDVLYMSSGRPGQLETAALDFHVRQRRSRQRYPSEPQGKNRRLQNLESKISASYDNPALSLENENLFENASATNVSEKPGFNKTEFVVEGKRVLGPALSVPHNMKPNKYSADILKIHAPSPLKCFQKRFSLDAEYLKPIYPEKRTLQEIGRVLSGLTIPATISENNFVHSVKDNNGKPFNCSIDLPPAYDDVITADREKSCFMNMISVFIHPMFLVISCTYSLYFFIRVCIFTIIGDYAADIGTPHHDVHFALMTLSTADLVGTLCLGWVTDKKYLSRRHYVALCFVMICASLMAMPFTDNFVTFLVVVSVYGIFESSALTMFPLLIAHYISEEMQAVSIASNNLLVAPTMLLVSIVIGYFRDNQGSYVGMFYLLAGISALCSITWFIIPNQLRRHTRKSKG